MPRKPAPVELDASGSYDTYLAYNKDLRTWLVAFGGGAAALFLVNDTIARRLDAQGELRWVVLLFLAGTGLQIGNAFINKVANWYTHAGYTDGKSEDSRIHKTAEWIARQFWIDIAIDVLTITFYAVAVSKLLDAFAGQVA